MITQAKMEGALWYKPLQILFPKCFIKFIQYYYRNQIKLVGVVPGEGSKPDG